MATAAYDFETLELTLGSGAELLSLGSLRSETVITHHKTDRRKREVGIDEVRHGKVMCQHFGEECFGLILGDIDTRFIEVELWVRHDAMQGIGIEPLPHKALNHGIGMLSPAGGVRFPVEGPSIPFLKDPLWTVAWQRDDRVSLGQRGFVGWTLCQEVGQPGGKIEVIHSFGIDAAIQEAGRNKNIAKDTDACLPVAMTLPQWRMAMER